jgi:hypothetical protein
VFQTFFFRIIGSVIFIVALSIQSSSGQDQPKSGVQNHLATADPSTSEAAAKKAILGSQQWNQVYDEFQRWLSNQAIYTPDDVERIKANLSAQIRVASASELQDVVDDWQAKLRVLNGRDFQEAQQWLGEYLSVFVDGIRRQRLQQLGLTNVENMSAAQLEDAVLRIRAHRLNAMQRRAAFDQSREQRVLSAQQNNAARQLGQQQARTGAGQFMTNASPDRPEKFNPPPAPRRQFFMGPDGRLMYSLPY